MYLACQIGAREHYAIPRALIRNNTLQCLCTDIWASPALRSLGGLLGRRGRSLSYRHHAEIPSDLVTHWTGKSISRQWRPRAFAGGSYERFIVEGQWFAGMVRSWLRDRQSIPSHIFSYDTSALEIFEWAKAQGIKLVLGQIDPGRFEADLVAREREIWTGWEAETAPVPESYHERRAAEWELADTIMINSKWSRDALLGQGVPETKLRIVPLVYEPCGRPLNRESAQEKHGRLKLLFLGQVNLRKGIPYLLEAARLARGAVDVTIVGPIQISRSAVASAPPNVRFIGPVSRSEAAEQYRRADAFVLPTLSDGFAITQLEAMAHGLPVIITPHCGAVVTDGVDGLIVPARDVAALAEAILALANDFEQLASMGAAAVAKSRQFPVSRLAEHLAAI